MYSYNPSFRIIYTSAIILQLCWTLTEAFSTSHQSSFCTSTLTSASRPSHKSSRVHRQCGYHHHDHASLLSSTVSSTSLFQQSQEHSYNAILESIDEIFPPNLLDQRIALSRKDGYWPFISEGEDPPQEFVYGEFDVEFFCRAIRHARTLHPNPQVFCDLGSGTGRLVLVGAALADWKLVRGIELLPGIHEQAVEKLEACRRQGRDGSDGTSSSSTSTNSSPSTTSGGTTSEPIASGSDLDDYWKQYKQFTAPSPTDDWLNDLSTSLTEEEENDDETSLTDGGLYLPKTSTVKEEEDPVLADSTAAVQNDNALSYSTTTDGSSDYVLGTKHQLPLAPIQLSCGSFDDPYEFFGDADVVFCFSSAMPYHVMVDMARAVGRQCLEGTLVLTTEYRLPEGGTIEPVENDPRVPFGDYALELVEELNGTNEATGGESTVFVHRLTKSLGTGVAMERPKPNVSDMCYNAIESLQKNDPQRFLRKVSNQMMFLGLPDSWLPKLDDLEGGAR